MKHQKEQMRFLREDIKLQALITDVNHRCMFHSTPARTSFDLVDNHSYWDHPLFPGKRWSTPAVFHNRCSIEEYARTPISLAATRVFGKPFTVTEFNYCVPNQWRAEAATLMGGYSALQDWDGLYRFAWANGANAIDPNILQHISNFSGANNIQHQMADRIIAMLFTRGDVSPAPLETRTAFLYDPKHDYRTLTPDHGFYPDSFHKLALWGLTGSTTTEYKGDAGVRRVDALADNWTKALPEAAQQALEGYEKTGRITSVTDQLTLDSRNRQAFVITPRSEVVTGQGTLAGTVLARATTDSFQTVALLSLDDLPLTESRRILAIQLANVLNNNMKYELANKLTVRDWGNPPYLMERALAKLQLRLPHNMTVTPLALDGTPADKPYPATYENGILSFQM